jgi:(2R)-3-sulfolactate dehydrogenase (NADP+)
VEGGRHISKAARANETALTCQELSAICAHAARRAGASAAQAELLAQATVEAESRGRGAVGLAHLFDYLDGFRSGRIADAAPGAVVERSPVVGSVDCRRGLAQQGFQTALPWLLQAVSRHGLAVATVHRCYTAGELGYYVRRLAAQGLLAVVAANSPALMAVAGSRSPILGTNPLAFGLRLADGRTLAVDQACSATAWVSVREAQRQGELLPPDVAVDADGSATRSATEALAGALLPFGGYKGGNVALLVELLALLAGGSSSADAAPFDRGSASPEVGVLVLAIDADLVMPGYRERVQHHVDRWRDDHGADITVWTRPPAADPITVSRSMVDQLRGLGEAP